MEGRKEGKKERKKERKKESILLPKRPFGSHH
jgi:hypothetical protein